MALTRANVEYLLLRRVGSLFSEVGLNGATSNNSDLDDPMGYAIRKSGGSVADATAVADADVTTVAEADVDQMLDLAELRALETARTAARRLVTTSLGPRREQLSDIAEGLEKDIAAKRADIMAQYGIVGSTIEGGVVSLRFAETNS